MKRVSILTGHEFDMPEGAEACKQSGHVWRVRTKLIPVFGARIESKPFKICARCEKKGDLDNDSE